MSSVLARSIASSVDYLQSAEAAASIARDPYWPKWHSPWWHVLALREAGVEPPPEAVRALAAASAQHYLTFFPRAPETLPQGKSARSDVMCFCALGSLLSAAKDGAIDWAGDFLARYQLSDGGWNCDERSVKSSVVSTVPVLEYLVGKAALSSAEQAQLDRGVAFLLGLRLFRSRRTGAVLNEAWLQPTLPRFYEYDVLRGLRLVARWVERTGAAPPPEVAEARERMARWFASGAAPRCWPSSVEARGAHGVESSFELCDALGRAEVALPILAAEWAPVCARLE